MIAIYTRQSVDKKDSISIESQIDFCQREFDSDDFKVYSDKGYSGKNTNRPCFNEMISDIKGGSITKVIVYKVDRISRSLLDFANIIETFKKFGVEFQSTQEKFDTSMPMGNAMLSITMVFAQLERETIQQRITDNYYQRGKKGFFLGGTVPYGFENTKIKVNQKNISTLIANEKQSEVMQTIFNLYAYKNYSLGQISEYLNKRSIPSATGVNWDSSRISILIRSPIYVKANADVRQYYQNKGCVISNDVSDFIGDYACNMYGKRESNERKYTNVKNHVLSLSLHKGIVDADTFLKCQHRLDNNNQIKNTGTSHKTWLSGLVKCGHCGYAFVVTHAQKNNTSYFRCSGKSNKKICKGHTVPYRVLEIENFVKTQLINVLEYNKNYIYHTTEKNNYQDNAYKIELVKVEQQITNLIKQMACGESVIIKYVTKHLTELDIEKSKLEQKINDANSNVPSLEYEKQLMDLADGWDELSIEDKKIIVQFFIEKIDMTNGKISIKWKHNYKLNEVD